MEFLDVEDNIALFNQAQQRIDRMGQKKNITTNIFVATNTVEEKLYNLMQQRRQAQSSNNNNINNNGPNAAARFTTSSDSNQLTSYDMNTLLM